MDGEEAVEKTFTLLWCAGSPPSHDVQLQNYQEARQVNLLMAWCHQVSLRQSLLNSKLLYCEL